MPEGENSREDDLAEAWEEHYSLGAPERPEPFSPLLGNIGKDAVALYYRTTGRYEKLRNSGGPINELLDKIKTPAGRLAIIGAIQDTSVRVRIHRFVEDPWYRPDDDF